VCSIEEARRTPILPENVGRRSYKNPWIHRWLSPQRRTAGGHVAQLTTATNPDGRIELFGYDANDRQIKHDWQFYTPDAIYWAY
jgi:YD repeat-containing protein